MRERDQRRFHDPRRETSQPWPRPYFYMPPNQPRLGCGISRGTLPLNFAFDVFLRDADGKEFRLGYAVMRKDEVGTVALNYNPPATMPAQVDVILRSSRQAAAQTLDIDSIWEGELVFPNIKLYRADLMVLGGTVYLLAPGRPPESKYQSAQRILPPPAERTTP